MKLIYYVSISCGLCKHRELSKVFNKAEQFIFNSEVECSRCNIEVPVYDLKQTLHTTSRTLNTIKNAQSKYLHDISAFVIHVLFK